MSHIGLHRSRTRPRRLAPDGLARFGVLILCICATQTFGAYTSHATHGSLSGMTGLINVPTAHTLDDGVFRLGVSFIDKKWAYAARHQSNSTQYSLSLGFLANVELGFRASVAEGSRFIESVAAPKVDRMGSARLRVLRESRWPAVALGIDDVRGTRSHHALYVVGTKTLVEINGKFSTVMSLGYGSKALQASRHVLKGMFSGIELSTFDRLGLIVEFDTEKWNSGIRLGIARVHTTVALMGLDTLSGGVNWTQRF